MARDVEKHQLVAGSREIVLFSHADSLHSPYPDQVLVCQWRSAPNSAFVYYREWLDGETKRTSDTGHPPPLALRPALSTGAKPHLTVTWAHPPSNFMFASVLGLADIPLEILEHVFLHLPGQDVIKMEAVSRRFRTLIRNSPTLQYRCELFAAGLIDNPSNHCDLVERRKLCEKYAHKWSEASIIVTGTHKVPTNQSSRWDNPTVLGRNMVVSYSSPNGGLDILSIPPVASGKPIDGWTIPPFPFKVSSFAVYHPENLLAVVEHQEDFLRIHLLNLRDGSPYCAPPFDVITWVASRDMPQIWSEKLSITGSRIMLCFSHNNVIMPDQVLVWDRKTGNLVLHLPSKECARLGGPGFLFLDEFRIVVPTAFPMDPPGLIVFNTLIPQDHPRSLRRFRLPPGLHGGLITVHVDPDGYLETPYRDVPFIADPTQTILVVQALKLRELGSVWFIVQIQDLMKNVLSTRTDVCIPWDEWGRGAVIMEIPPHDLFSINVHGIHVILLHWKHQVRPTYVIRSFDFGRRGRSALPLRDEEGGWVGRNVSFGDGRVFTFQAAGRENTSSWSGVQSLGDGIFFLLASQEVSPESDIALHVWELT